MVLGKASSFALADVKVKSLLSATGQRSGYSAIDAWNIALDLDDGTAQ